MAIGSSMYDSNGRFIGSASDMLASLPSAARRPSDDPTTAFAPADYSAPTAAPTDDSTVFGRNLRRAVGDIGPEVRSLAGLGQSALGFTDAGRANIQQGQSDIQQNALRDPDQTLNDTVRDGNWGDYAAAKFGALLPSAAMMLLPGGVTGKVAGKVATTAARSGITSLAESSAAKYAADQLASGALKVAPQIAEKYGAEAATRAALKKTAEEALPDALKTVRYANPELAASTDAAAAQAGASAQAAGNYVGTAAGALPGVAAGSNQDILDATSADDQQTRAIKGLVGSTVGAALSAVIPGKLLERLGGGGAVKDAVSATAQRFLPAVAKTAVKEGALMAGLNTVQTASALATHSWMTDHFDILPPGAAMQYADSLATGLMFGTAFGAVGGVAEHAPRVDFAAQRAKLATGMQDSVNNLRAAVKKGMGETESAPDTGTPVPEQKPVAAEPAAAAPTAEGLATSEVNPSDLSGDERSAFDRFTQNRQGLQDKADQDVESAKRSDDIEARYAQFMKSGEGELGNAPRAPVNPVPLDSRLQNTLMSFVPHDSLLWKFPETAQAVAKTAEKLFTGTDPSELNPKHLAILNEAVGSAELERWAHDGPAFGEMTDLTKKVSNETADTTKLTEQEQNTQTAQGLERQLSTLPPGAERDKVQAQLADAQSRTSAAQIDAHDDPRAPAPTDSAEFSPKPDEGKAVGINDRPVEDLPTAALSQKVIDATPGTPEHAQAQADLRDSLIGHRDTDPNRQYREMRTGEGKNNVIVGNNDAQVQKTLKRGFEIESDHPGKPLIVDIQNLVKKKLSGADGERMAGNAFGALTETMGDLQLAGVKVKPETIKAGVEYAPGAKLTPNQAMRLRMEANAAVKPAHAGKVLDATVGINTKARGDLRTANSVGAVDRARQAEGTVREVANRGALAQEKLSAARRNSDVQEVKPVGEADNRIDDGQLLTRRAPPEAPAPDSRAPGEAAKVEQAGGIADVQHAGPYDKVLTKAREDLIDAKTPAARGAIKHDTGVKIGQAELDKQLVRSQISDARYTRETAALKDYSTGKSRDYLQRAGKGEFDHFKVTESRGENAEPKESADAVAKQESTPATGATEPKNAARKAVDPAEAKLAKADAEARSDKLDEDIKVGFDEAAKDEGPHDVRKETQAMNAVLDRVGVASRVRVHTLPENMREGRSGLYRPGNNTIYINPNLHGAKRVEVLAHELGHHILRNTIGEQLEHATPELRDALLADHAAWVESHNADSKVSDVLASRKPYFRAGAIEEGSNGMTVAELAASDKKKMSYLFDHEEYLADNIAKFLTQNKESQSIIGKFFSSIADTLRSAYDALFKAGEDKYKPAPSVEKWMQGLFDQNVRDASGALGETLPKETADAGVSAAVHMAHNDGGAPPMPPGKNGIAGGAGAPRGTSVLEEPGFAPYKTFVENHLSPDARGIAERALYRRVLMDKIRESYEHDVPLQKALENPEHEIAALMYVGDKMLQDGRITLGPKATEVTLGIRTKLFKMLGVAGDNDFAIKLFEDIRSGEIKRTLDAGNKYDVRDRVADAKGDNATRQRIFNAVSQVNRDSIYQPWRRQFYGTTNNAHLSYTPALRAANALFKVGTGAISEHAGYEQQRMRGIQGFNTQLGKALGELKPVDLTAVSQHLREHTTPTDAAHANAVNGAYQLTRDMFDYARKAGVAIKSRGPNHFPVVMDPTEVVKREGDFRALVGKPEFEEGIRAVLNDTKSTHAELIDKLVKMASSTASEHEVSTVNPLAPPDLRALNPRVLQTIYDKGTPEDIKAFADFQQKDLSQSLFPYITGLVNRAEFARRAGDDGSRLHALFAKAVTQGAHEKDIQYTKDAIAAFTGAYGADGSPFVRSIFGDKAAKWVTSTPVKRFTDTALAYQNVRNLSLSLLSALADPMGIGVRYGGIRSMEDLSQAWKSFSGGMGAIFKTSSSQDLRDQASIIAMAGDYITSSILSSEYSPNAAGIGAKVSDFMFKANGLSKYVEGTRYMALSAANAFLLKHAAGRDAKHSARYLRELKLEPGDVVPGKNGFVKALTQDDLRTATPEEAARDERVKAALNQFVDESILRTDAGQSPLYFNDPAFRLVTQYKQFMYAFDSQILERITHEAHYSNFAPIVPLLAYVPVTIAAEMTRAAIQYGPGGNPAQQDFGPLDWAAGGACRWG